MTAFRKQGGLMKDAGKLYYGKCMILHFWNLTFTQVYSVMRLEIIGGKKAPYNFFFQTYKNYVYSVLFTKTYFVYPLCLMDAFPSL